MFVYLLKMLKGKKVIKKLFYLLPLVFVACSMPTYQVSDVKSMSYSNYQSISEDPTSEEELANLPVEPGNMLKNGSFSILVDNNPSGWTKSSYIGSRVKFQVEKGGGLAGSDCVSIAHSLENASKWCQKVKVTPGEIYVLSGWLKAENISSIGDEGFYLGLNGTWIRSDDPSTSGTFGWKKESITFIADSTGYVDVALAFGWWGCNPSGKVYFDDITLTVASNYSKVTSKNVSVYLNSNDTASVSSFSLNRWVTNLSISYDDYLDLVGTKPFNGEKINVLSVDYYPGGWAVSGNPILWDETYVRP